MAIADLKNVLKIFGGSDIHPDQEQALYKETLLMTLARAADADINIQPIEVDRIREILRDWTREDFSAKDIRMAAREELYAKATLMRYLASVRRKLTDEHCANVVRALADVFRADKTVSVLEVDFYNNVADALKVTPAQIAGLVAGEVRAAGH